MRTALAFALVLPLVSASPAPAQVVPPPETLRRAEAALGLLDGRGFVGTYRVTTKAHVVATGEDGPEDALEIEEVTIAADGTRTNRLIQAVEDGRDVTAKRLAGENAGHDNDGESEAGSHDELDLELVPLGAHASRHAFTPGRVRDGVATARFAPRKRGGEDDELGRGEIAWDVVSGDPLWIEAGLAEKRTGLSELVLRFEFARAGDVLYPRVIHTRTKAGIPLLFKLRLNIDIEISELRPAAAPHM
jgi:hypothetical protein